jgi:hypothetical protein
MLWWKMLFKNFDLTLENSSKFEVAKFERQVYKSHFNRLKRAIINGELLDNVLTVIPSGNRYRIIDGQHRIEALKMALATKSELSDYPLPVSILNLKSQFLCCKAVIPHMKEKKYGDTCISIYHKQALGKGG